ncbi:MFS transporter [Nocardioides sp. AN3]
MDFAALPIAAPSVSPADLVALQRRTLRVLAVGQATGAAGLGAAMTVSAFVVEDIVGVHTPWVGVASTALTAGSGVAAELLSRIMRRRGRRVGMTWGYAAATLGCLVAFVGDQRSMLPLFVLGMFLYGAGAGTNLLARYAATDLAEPGAESRAMGRILFASTFGSVFGPLLVEPAEQLGLHAGLDRYSGPWLLGAVCFATTGLLIGTLLRPDPLRLRPSHRSPTPPPTTATTAARSSLGAIRDSGGASLALLAMVVVHAIMVGLFALAPLEMRSHDHESAGPWMVSLHVAAMFAFAPIAGRVADCFGPLVGITAGTLLVAVACVLSLGASTSVDMMFAAMFALGLGWALAYIAGSTMLTASVAPSSRVSVQGTADLITAVGAGVASIVYGFGLDLAGFGAVAVVSVVLIIPVLGAIVRGRGLGRIEAA